MSLVMPASVGKAFERATTGVFWLLHEHLRLQEGTPERLTTHFGSMFEDYCLRLVESAGPSIGLVTGEIEYATSDGGARSTDVIVCSPLPSPVRVFVEVSAIRPPVALLADPSADHMEIYLDRVMRKLRQLHRCIEDHRVGQTAITGDPVGGGATYVPVLVVDEPSAWSPSLRVLIDRAVSDLGLFSMPDVTRPVLCDVGEVEHLVYVCEQGNAFAPVLVDYLQATSGRQPIEQFLYERFQLDAPTFVTDGFTAMGERLVEALRFS